MKIKQLILGITLAATTLTSIAIVPAFAGDSPKLDEKSYSQEPSEPNLDKAYGKRRCFFKRVRVFKHHRYVYIRRRVCTRGSH